MAVELWSYIVDPGDGTIKMAHVFYGATETEARKYYDEHLSHCKYMQGAESGEGKGELLEEIVTVDAEELPSPDDFDDEEETDEDEDPEETDEDEG